ncbi:hypothetical protein TNCV_58101 [Trichonephila clavipes]|nr:hypothetical protein TNCV_58101 [Trichonephila clavipes]
MDAETAEVLRGRAKADFQELKILLKKDDKNFNIKYFCNKLEKLKLIYTEFDKTDAALPFESSGMEEFEAKHYETKGKLQNILENLSVRINVYNDNDQTILKICQI